jgi:teichoic acid transport system ATP-binding protein
MPAADDISPHISSAADDVSQRPIMPVASSDAGMDALTQKMEYPVEVNGVTKTYHIYGSDIKRALGTMGLKVEHHDFVAVDDLSYRFEKGEVTAILGRNGSGKSTLLKLITGVTQPDKGMIATHGRISAMLELKSGFDGELTGEENIYYKALTMGIPEADIERVKDEIIAFADIGIHINQPFRTYSSGMKARLGFAVAASVDPDILIIDEVLAVGDDIFKMKCIAKMNEFRAAGKTILFVSHALSTVKAFCTRAIWLNQGKLMAQGSMGDVVVQYSEFLKGERAKARLAIMEEAEKDDVVLGKQDVLVAHWLKYLDKDGNITRNLSFGQPWGVVFDYTVKRPVTKLTAAFSIENAEGVEVYSSDKQACKIDNSMGDHAIKIDFGDMHLIAGEYKMTVEIWDVASSLMVRAANRYPFWVVQGDYVGTGINMIPYTIRQIPVSEVPRLSKP